MSPRKSKTRLAIEIGLAAVALVLVFVWSEGLLRSKVGPALSAEPDGEVWRGETATVREREIGILHESAGTVRPVREALISSRVMGTIERIPVVEGDRVRRGDLLASVGAPELAARSASARQATEAARAALEQARSDLARIRRLHEREAATAVELEKAVTATSIAEAEVARAEEAARGEESIASYGTLRAPFDGIVSEKLLDVGDLARPGAPVIRIEGAGRYRLEAPVQATVASRIKVGDAVELMLREEDGWVATSVGEIVPAADPISRTVLVRADLPEDSYVRSGQYGRLRVRHGTRSGLVVPAVAVRRYGGMSSVSVIDDQGRAETRYVRTGADLGDGLVEILSGLSADEKVALRP